MFVCVFGCETRACLCKYSCVERVCPLNIHNVSSTPASGMTVDRLAYFMIVFISLGSLSINFLIPGLVVLCLSICTVSIQIYFPACLTAYKFAFLFTFLSV